MGQIANGMVSLCGNIMTAYGERKKILDILKRDTKDLKTTSKKFINDCRKLRKETTKILRKGLKNDREALIGIINSLREDFRKNGREIRADLKEASKIWRGMENTLKGKKKK